LQFYGDKNLTMKKIFLAATIFSYSATNTVFSQSFAINTDGSAANASALLDVKSTLKGMLIPRMSRTERNAIASPATGLLIFQNSPDSIGFYYYNGTAWTWILSNANSDLLAWKTGGNSGTLDASHFIGTTDNVPFNIKVNNQKAGRIDHISWNSFYGYQSGNAVTSGIHNTAMGYQSLISNTTGTNNTAIGTLAANSNTTGDQNTAMGYGSMYDNTVGIYNTAYGFYALYQNKAGSNATAIGVQSMLYANNTTTPFINNNVAVGYESLKGNAPASGNTGLNNTALGYQTLFNNSSASNNTAVGLYALNQNTTSGRNTAVGSNALYSQSFSNSNIAWSSENVAIGDSALYSNQPTAISNGNQNTAVGNRALRTNTIGWQNTAMGNLSLFSNTIGQLNTANGWASLYKNDEGYYNTALGAMAMYYNTTGGYNVGVGTVSLHHNLTGSGNTAVGQQAGLGTMGNSFSNNTIIGYQSGYNLTTGSNNVFLGNQAGYNVTSGSNKLYIANSNVDPPLIYGDFSTGNIGLGTSAPSSKLEVCGNVRVIGTIVASGTITTSAISCPSDLRYKKNITPLTGATEKLMLVNAVRYNWRREEFPNMSFNDKLQTGFIAQDLEKIFPEMVFTDDAGYKSIDYSRLTPLLVETIREQQTQIAEIKKRLHEIEKMLVK